MGAIGARPAAFNTARYGDKILEHHGISVETLDLSEICDRIQRMSDHGDYAQARLLETAAMSIPATFLIRRYLKMAKLGVVINQWMAATQVTVSALQCWTSIEENLWRRALHGDDHDDEQRIVPQHA